MLLQVVMLLFMAFAFVFFILAGLGTPEQPRFRFVGWGLAFWVIVEIIKLAIGTSGGHTP
jgi:hypothetical protein